MKTYYIEAYELWKCLYATRADSAAEALENFKNGNADIIDDTSEYLEWAENYGVDCKNFDDDIQTELRVAGVSGMLDGIRDISSAEGD